MEKVYVENELYDGPRTGIADFNSVPHRFIAQYRDLKAYFDTFYLIPISKEELELEIEQWNIFVEWNKEYEAKKVSGETHPGYGELNKRWDEIENILRPKRELIPEGVLVAKATFEPIDQKSSYESSGPDYGVVWKLIG